MFWPVLRAVVVLMIQISEAVPFLVLNFLDTLSRGSLQLNDFVMFTVPLAPFKIYRSLGLCEFLVAKTSH